MADLAVWQRTIVDEEGNVVPGAEIEVRREEDDSLATLYADRAGETPLANPMTADMSGFVRFFASGGAYTIEARGAGSSRTWRFDPTGRLQEFDRVSEALVADDAADLLSARANLGAFSTVADVQNSHIPAVLESIRTLGRDAPGDGPPLDLVRGLEVPGAVQSADGQWWEDLGHNTITVKIPTDFPTLQAAVDHYSRLPMRQGAKVELLIESGHQLTHGLYISDGDYGKFWITSEDQVVEVDDNFVGAKDGEGLITGNRCRMPVLACRIDMKQKAGNGYTADHNSIGHVFTNTNHFNGIVNAGNNGLSANRGSVVTAESSIWSGAGRSGIRAQQASTVAAQNSILNDCMWAVGSGVEAEGAFIASRGSILHLQNATVLNSANRGGTIQRSWGNLDLITIDGSALDGLMVQLGSHVTAREATMINNGVYGLQVQDLSFVTLFLATIKDNASENIWFGNRGGGIVNITAADIGGSPATATNIPGGYANVWTGRGILSNRDAPNTVESGVEANGDRWVRTADGVQICWGIREVNPTQNGSGTWDDPYRSNTVQWNYPVSFAGDPPQIYLTPRVHAPSTTQRPSFCTFLQPFNTNVTGVQMWRIGSDDDDSGTTYAIQMMAVGRWNP